MASSAPWGKPGRAGLGGAVVCSARSGVPRLPPRGARPPGGGCARGLRGALGSPARRKLPGEARFSPTQRRIRKGGSDSEAQRQARRSLRRLLQGLF